MWTASVWVGIVLVCFLHVLHLEADQVTNLQQGRITFTGATHAHLAHAPQDIPAARPAEAAYTAVSALVPAQESW